MFLTANDVLLSYPYLIDVSFCLPALVFIMRNAAKGSIILLCIALVCTIGSLSLLVEAGSYDTLEERAVICTAAAAGMSVAALTVAWWGVRARRFIISLIIVISFVVSFYVMLIGFGRIGNSNARAFHFMFSVGYGVWSKNILSIAVLLCAGGSP